MPKRKPPSSTVDEIPACGAAEPNVELASGNPTSTARQAPSSQDHRSDWPQRRRPGVGRNPYPFPEGNEKEETKVARQKSLTTALITSLLAFGLAMPVAAAEKSLEGSLGYYDPDS